MTSLWRSCRAELARPVDGASLGVFRIAVGLALLGESIQYLRPQPGGSLAQQLFPDGIERTLLAYPGLEFLRPWPYPFMIVHFLALAAAGACIAIGSAYRLAVLAAFLLWTFFWLLDAGMFNNHYYLQSLFAFLLLWMPADRCLSVRSAGAAPAESREVPFWTVVLLRFQLLVVYFFGGVAKLNYDWIVRAEPMRTVLALALEAHPDLPGGLRALLATDAAAHVLSIGGLAYDLAIGPLMLLPRTRLLGIVLTVIFHGLNHFLLFEDIGVFPFLGLAATTIFLEPDWPRRLWAWLSRPRWIAPDGAWFLAGLVLLPPIGAALGWRLGGAEREAKEPSRPLPLWQTALLAAWVLWQALLPMRHFLIPGDVLWTSEGEYFSWRMKAGVKRPAVPLVLIVDSEIARPSDGRGLLVDWKALDAAPAVYRDVDARTIDGMRLPGFFVEFQPLWGERMMLCPFSPDWVLPGSSRPPSERLVDRWQTVFGRRPTLEETLPLEEAIDKIVADATAAPVDGALLERLKEAPRWARIVADPSASQEVFVDGYERLRAILADAAVDVRIANRVRGAVKRLDPFALEGAPRPPAPSHLVEDAALANRGPTGYFSLRRDAWRADVFSGAGDVWIDFERLGYSDWISLPKEMVVRLAGGQPAILENPTHRMPWKKIALLGGNPILLRQYAREAAARWEKRFGRRPQVRVIASVSVNGRPARTLLDPSADLAAVSWTPWGSHPWIWAGGEASRGPSENTHPTSAKRGRAP